LNESYDEPFSIKEEKLRKTSRKKTVIGVLMLLSLVVLPILVFYIQFWVPSNVMIFIFLGFGAIGFAGLAMVFWYGKGASLFFQGLDMLKKLSPPDPIITGRCVVMDKNPVYGIGTWGSNVLMFVAFYSLERVFHQKTKVPRTIWTWEYKLEIDGAKVARREGTYTIPLGNDECYTGEGVLYALMLESGGYISIQRDYSPEQLNQIVAHLEKEVTSYGAGRQSIDGLDEFN
jgi:hypothetical protein